MEEDILFLERLLSEDPSPPLSMNLNQAKSSIEEPEHSFSMGYEHFNTTLVTKLDEVVESSIKNLVPIPRECKVTSDNGSESNEPVKDDSSVFTTFPNPLFNDSDDVTSNDEDVQIEESKVHSNPLFDDDEINSDELESHVESNVVESLSNHDALIDLREHAEYISRMEILFTINLRPRPTMNANIIIESIPSSLIPIQDNDSPREEIDIVTNTDELLPPGFENDDLDGEIDAVEELHVDNSISNSENDLSDSEASDFDNPIYVRGVSLLLAFMCSWFGALVMPVIEMCEHNTKTRSAGRLDAESRGGRTGGPVGRGGGKGRRPREGNDERVDDLNGHGNDK
nr:hypothetical protein [Tanacetum cinerariifolium]